MKVSLVAITQPLIPGISSAEDLLVYTARVSSPSNRLNLETGERLLRYCLRKAHWSVFEQASMTVEVETSLAIATQILRHRSFTFQQFSQRYSDASGLGFEDIRPRRQDEKSRQSSHDDLDPDVYKWFRKELSNAEESARQNYQTALRNGVAKESARFLLPQSTTTRLYMNGCVRSWIHYLQARRAPETQAEHREVAEAVWGVFKEQFPMVAKALEEEK